MRYCLLALCLLLLALPLTACEEESEVEYPPAPPPLVSAYFDVSDDAGFFDCPFPIEHMRRADGTVRFNRFPNRHQNFMADIYLAQADEVSIGFSRNGPVHFRFDGVINRENLPQTWPESLAENCPVFLVNIDWRNFLGSYTPQYLLTLLPYQGRPLAAGELYAAVVLRSLGDNRGEPLAIDPTFAAALDGQWPDGDFAALDAPAFTALAAYLDEAAIGRDEVAVATAFRTADPAAQMLRLRKAFSALSDPAAENITVIAEYPKYYVLEGWLDMPIYQDGSRPYWESGGKIHFDQAGRPILQWWERVRFSVSVPKQTMPNGGWPLLFYANGQGGTYTQIFDRSPGGEISGEGPGKLFAHRGISCLDIEAPLSGPRHPLGSYQGIEFFNFLNLGALTDNIRQAAGEFTYLVKLARHLRIDPALCPEADAGGADAFSFDADNFFFYGHSTGSAIGHLVLAVEPGFRAGLLTGAGVSWIYNVIYKQLPFPIGPVFKWLLNVYEFDEYHPLMTLFQTANEASEASNFDAHLLHDPLPGNRPKDILLFGGYIDGYFPPPMIEGMAVAVGVDLAGEEVYPGTVDALETLAGREQLDYPVRDNIEVGGHAYTGAIVQYEAPAGMDGHYVTWRTNEPRYQYTCFFKSIAATGQAILSAPNGDVYAPCW